MNRYCTICEKEVTTSYILVEHGIRYAVGTCGHKTRIEEVKVSGPTFIMRGSGWHNSDYRKVGSK
jgi:predicted nucleic acid-binding Zn ribbon protein